jgi:WbqC-like protein family
MRVAVHQPQFLPYPGFFHKLSLVDTWVVMDDVQYDKRFTNRNRILAPSGPIWLTVPIDKAGKFGKNSEVLINNGLPWREEHWKKITYSYKNARWFHLYGEFFEGLYGREHTNLFDLDMETTSKIIEWLGIKVSVVRESELKVESRGTQRLIDACKAVGGDTYVSGSGGKGYMDEALFPSNGIKLEYAGYKSVSYAQRFGETFVPDLSSIDLLFNMGPESSRLVRGGVSVSAPQ